MPRYSVEVEGETVQSVWGLYTVEAEDMAEADDIARELFYDENYAVDIVEVTVQEDED